MCWICGRAVGLDTSKTDEHGCAVHELCYVAKIALSNESRRAGTMPPQPEYQTSKLRYAR